MGNKDTVLAGALAGLGALPFVACAVLTRTGVDSLPWLGSVPRLAAIYGVAISAFMAGVHWGTHLYNSGSTPTNLLVTSNVITVSVVVSYLLATVPATLLVLAAAFVLLLLVDHGLYRRGVITSAYFRLRWQATAVVVVSLLATVG